MSENDEFKNRDAQGLSGKHKSEADARSQYFKMFAMIMFLASPAIASAFIVGANVFIPGQAAMVARKFAIISEYELHFVFIAWCASFYILWI